MKMAKISGTPLSLSASILSSSGDELLVTAGKVQARRAERFLEFALPSAGLTVRASWKPRGPKSRDRAQGLTMKLSVNGSRPENVIARGNALYADEAAKEPMKDERLAEIGRVLAEIKLNAIPDFGSISPPSVGGSGVGVAFGVRDWLGCVADATGAGAGIGGAGGFAIGGIAGATTGGVGGGAVGGAIGLGACTTIAILEWLFD